jgi:hypothetical protein
MSITAPTCTSLDLAATAPLAAGVAKVLTALHRLGEATAAGTATAAGLGYSTTTPKLRTLENQGLAEPVRGDDGRTLWRLTAAGRAHAEHGGPGPAGTQPAAEHTFDGVFSPGCLGPSSPGSSGPGWRDSRLFGLRTSVDASTDVV